MVAAVRRTKVVSFLLGHPVMVLTHDRRKLSRKSTTLCSYAARMQSVMSVIQRSEADMASATVDPEGFVGGDGWGVVTEKKVGKWSRIPCQKNGIFSFELTCFGVKS